MILTNNVSSATIQLKIKEKWKPKINLSYNLVPLSNGNYSSVDRGSYADSYSCEVITYGKQDYIDSIVEFLQDVRDDGFDISLSSFNEGEYIFGENVVYSSPIKVAITDIDEVTHRTFKGVGVKLVFEVDDSSLLIFNGSGLMPVLECLQAKYVADTSWNYNIDKSYGQKHFVNDHVYDIGMFDAEFIVSKTSMKEMREFYRQQRGDVFQVDNALIKGIDEIFGARNSALPNNVRIIDIQETFVSVNLYKMKIKFAQEQSIGVM